MIHSIKYQSTKKEKKKEKEKERTTNDS